MNAGGVFFLCPTKGQGKMQVEDGRALDDRASIRQPLDL